MYSEYKSMKDISSTHFQNGKAKWSSHHINILQRPVNLKVESVRFVLAAPKRTAKLVGCCFSFQECQIPAMWVAKVSWAQPQR